MKRVFLLVALLAAAQAAAQGSKPLHIVVPYAAGGGSDVIARNVGERMKTSLGQPVIIENITGASGTIGNLGCDRRWLPQ